MSSPAAPPPAISASARFLICTIAAIGFAFDIYELLMAPLVVRPALAELANIKPGDPGFTAWSSAFFYVPALLGGLVGLWGGTLTDTLGRRRVLTWSILLYAFSAFCAGFSTSLPMLLFFRTTTFIGVCVEFVAAVAWLAELFDDPVQRERVLGFTQAFSSIGGLMVAVANGLCIEYASSLPAIGLPEWLTGLLGGTIAEPHAAWRYTLMSGIIPAVPLILIRPFLPESPKWAARKAAGTLKRPRLAELFSPELKQTSIVATLMVAASYGVAFGAIQLMPQIVPGINAVQDVVKAKTEGKEPKVAGPIAKRIAQEKAADYTKSQELGGLVGRFAIAFLFVMFASRQALLRMFLVPGMIVTPLIFLAFARGNEVTYVTQNISFIPGFHDFSISFLGLAIFVAGFFTVAQFSFWGNYLPHAYPVHLRGTGESLAANIGGRIIGTSFYAVTQTLASFKFVPDVSPEAQMAYMAAGVAGFLYVVNFMLSFLLPEPKTEEH